MCGVARLTVSCCGTSAEWLFGISVVVYWRETRLTRGRITARLKNKALRRTVVRISNILSLDLISSSPPQQHFSCFLKSLKLGSVSDSPTLFSLLESSMWWERSCFSSTPCYKHSLDLVKALDDDIRVTWYTVLYPENNGGKSTSISLSESVKQERITPPLRHSRNFQTQIAHTRLSDKHRWLLLKQLWLPNHPAVSLKSCPFVLATIKPLLKMWWLHTQIKCPADPRRHTAKFFKEI